MILPNPAIRHHFTSSCRHTVGFVQIRQLRHKGIATRNRIPYVYSMHFATFQQDPFELAWQVAAIHARGGGAAGGPPVQVKFLQHVWSRRTWSWLCAQVSPSAPTTWRNRTGAASGAAEDDERQKQATNAQGVTRADGHDGGGQTADD